jgi:hypothetical protein
MEHALPGVSPGVFGQWVVMLGGVLAIVASAVSLWRHLVGGPEKREITPQPLHVQSVRAPATEMDCLERNRAVMAEVAGIKASARLDVGELHNKINSVDREVAEVRGQLALLISQLERIDQKLDRMAERQL